MTTTDDDHTSSQVPSTARQSVDETSSKDTLNPDVHVTMNKLNTAALEVNSADEIRQAIKAVLSGQSPRTQINGTNPVTLPIDTTSKDTRVSIRVSHEYKSKSGDQLILPKKDSTRKRRGRPLMAGPSKRVKSDSDGFYVGKLSNVTIYQRPNERKRRRN